ncbi:hypothetical protein FXV83_30845 [Bradyrhizobium hipponense]|uniref:Uncharacterized protein n=1 Tax=Bradyrhizobium hipponense TaxID=2605638 RepID=A0A5S4YR46_9BRAD|nr:hypothetical protein [Bradyrhizobium hipponense]TYO62799.1 hypothetical protein FXV83_30845 [Bradyrhizobium hipponense]
MRDRITQQFRLVNRAIPVNKRESMDAWLEKSNSDAAGGIVANRTPSVSVFDVSHRTRPGYGLEQKINALLANRTLCELP